MTCVLFTFKEKHIDISVFLDAVSFLNYHLFNFFYHAGFISKYWSLILKTTVQFV